MITFSDDPAGARVNMAHSHVSEYEYKGVKEGWPKYYWRPWKAYLKKLGG